jgi:hypothetical protein
MELHDCKTPEGRQPLDISPWTCPVCGDVWVADPSAGTGPPPSYDFANGEGVQPSKWRRIGQPGWIGHPGE